ncbi:MAG: hypothetical protein QF437_25035 [Planctomycetota bacterium]|nr:hypothetical protein [Planctomycetota bacterium]
MKLRAVDAVAWAWIACALIAVVALALDWAFELSVQARMAVACVSLLAWLVVLSRHGIFALWSATRLPLSSVSILLEEQIPDLESRIVTVNDLPKQAVRAENDTQLGFFALAVESAYRDTESHHFPDAISADETKRLAATATGLLLVCALTAALAPSAFFAALGRYTHLLQEYRQIHAQVSLEVDVEETDTVHIFEKPEGFDVAAIKGATVRARIVAHSNVDVPLRLFSRFEGTDEFKPVDLPGAEADLPRGNASSINGNFILLADVDRDTELYLQFGPQRSPVFRVRATQHPTIQNVQLRLRLPDYTKVKPQFIPTSDGNIRALYKSEVEISVQSDKPLRRGFFTIYGKRIAVKGHGRRISTRFLVTADGSYTVEVADRDGFVSQNKLDCRIDSLADQPPEVEVSAPDEVTLGKNSLGGVALRFRAQDDYGIEKIRLVYSVTRLPGVNLPTTRSAKPRKLERKINPRQVVNMSLPCRFGELGLEVGEVVTFHLEVEDTDIESGPHIARSKSMRIVVVGSELRDWIELEDEDRWPTDFVGFTGAKRATGIGRPGASPLVKDAGEKPAETSPGVSNTVEGYIPPAFRQSFTDYSNALNEE